MQVFEKNLNASLEKNFDAMYEYDNYNAIGSWTYKVRLHHITKGGWPTLSKVELEESPQHGDLQQLVPRHELGISFVSSMQEEEVEDEGLKKNKTQVG